MVLQIIDGRFKKHTHIIFRQRLFNYGGIIYQVLVLAVWYRINFEVSSRVTKDTTLEEVLGFDLLGRGED